MDQHAAHVLKHGPGRAGLRAGGLRLLAFLLACGLATVSRAAGPPPGADLVIVHARVYTVNAAQPWAEAVAVRGDRIVAVGSDSEIARWRSARTRVLDAGGRLLLPGFTDSHIHFMDGSISLARLNLDDTRTVADIQAALKAYAQAHPATDAAGAWILGRGWSYAEFPDTLPHKEDLDAVVPDRPIFLEGYDGHSYWANSKALALAGITRATPDPPNGIIVRDAAGEPTGALKEYAGDLVAKVVPQLTPAQRLAALRAGMALANQDGLVRMISCGGDFRYLDLFDQLRSHGELTLRLYVAHVVNPPRLTDADLAAIAQAQQRYHDDWIAAGAAKIFLDGVVETHTAAMLSPYSDDPSLSGKLFWEPGEYTRAVAELDRRGVQIFTHAIGERAVRLALDAYQQAERANHTRDSRDRVEHIETISAADIPRFGQLGVIASMQPLHAYPDSDTLDVWARAAGPERSSRAWSWRSIAAAGGHLAFGSDWPVVTFDPWQGLQEAVTRQTWEGTPAGGFVPEQRLTVAQAVEGYTLGAAYAGHREHSEGSIQPGKLADLIVLSQNIFTADPRRIRETKVLLTLVGGKMVYQSPGLTPPPKGKP